eukprot:comp56310_c0_seq1/m.47792 comp56310_c0_seq1/g.47792  ORF comp56310_c0_seq1/g.47792 comp56310_c0_seq1/m.47792 type:complete len:175 (-) comp56310_c0_seq1:527-1051(-)
MSKENTPKYVLWDRKADREAPIDWYGEELDENQLEKLTTGDFVRLIFMDPIPPERILKAEIDQGLSTRGWEKIYVQITKVDYYSKGGVNKPRKFWGKAMDTYRTIEPLRYVQTGEIVMFQRRNILEIPGWRADMLNLAGEQKGKEVVERERERMLREERRMQEEEWARRRQGNP